MTTLTPGSCTENIYQLRVPLSSYYHFRPLIPCCDYGDNLLILYFLKQKLLMRRAKKKIRSRQRKSFLHVCKKGEGRPLIVDMQSTADAAWQVLCHNQSSPWIRIKTFIIIILSGSSQILLSSLLIIPLSLSLSITVNVKDVIGSGKAHTCL